LGIASSRRKLVALTVGVSLLVTLLVVNLWPEAELIDYWIDIPHDIHDAQFRRTMSGLMGAPLLEGNRITTLRNQEGLSAMLSAIQNARVSVTFETYIFWSGEVGADFVEAFIERSRAGVPVRLILDWVGSTDLDTESLENMSDAGVKVTRYHPLAWYNLDKLNNRTHRKILVVDGRIGFTGGVGIADQWLGDAENTNYWRDTHFRIEGPVVAQLQSAFMENWEKSEPDLLHGERYFPLIAPAGDSLAQVVTVAANEGRESVRLSYLLSIAAARKRILIANPYFLPDHRLIQTLIQAIHRGVSVQIIVPGASDVLFTREASRGSWGKLLEAGVQIYEYEPTMFHAKVMVVDDAWVIAGSSNLDERSFLHNDEANINVLDPEFAAEQAKDFENDKTRSRRITLEEWRNRPLIDRFSEWVANLLRPQL
jgi:cardiolipin synthase